MTLVADMHTLPLVINVVKKAPLNKLPIDGMSTSEHGKGS